MAVAACGDSDKPTPPPGGSRVTESVLLNSAVMIGAGDIAVCGTPADEATGALVDSVLKADSVAKLTTLVFTLGDNAYPSGESGASGYFPRCFSPSWGRERITRAIRPSPGNHDYDTGSGDPYFSYFGASAGPKGKGYYSYDIGGWHVVSLNSELPAGSDNAGAKAQEVWLRQDLRDHPALCTMAYFHRPLFSSGRHGPDHTVIGLWEILYEGGADLILSGHEHHYERFKPQTPTGKYDPVRGIEQIIVGTGGAHLRNVESPLAQNSVTQIHGHYGVLKLLLGPGEFRHAFLDTDGRIWDPGGGKCH